MLSIPTSSRDERPPHKSNLRENQIYSVVMSSFKPAAVWKWFHVNCAKEIANIDFCSHVKRELDWRKWLSDGERFKANYFKIIKIFTMSLKIHDAKKSFFFLFIVLTFHASVCVNIELLSCNFSQSCKSFGPWQQKKKKNFSNAP